MANISSPQNLKISIVTISLNQANYIKQCIDSILYQDYTNIEYVVVDAGSTDGSRQIISSYKEITSVFEADDGPADGLNKGFAKCSGDYYGFVNSDDFLLPGAISQIVQEILDSGSEFLSGSGFIQSNNTVIPIQPTRLSLRSLLYHNAVIFQPSTFFSKDLFHSVGGFNIGNKTCWDYELFVDFLAAGAEHQITNIPISTFRIHSRSITGSNEMARSYQKDLERIFKKYMMRSWSIRFMLFSYFWRIVRKVSFVHE